MKSARGLQTSLAAATRPTLAIFCYSNSSSNAIPALTKAEEERPRNSLEVASSKTNFFNRDNRTSMTIDNGTSTNSFPCPKKLGFRNLRSSSQREFLLRCSCCQPYKWKYDEDIRPRSRKDGGQSTASRWMSYRHVHSSKKASNFLLYVKI